MKVSIKAMRVNANMTQADAAAQLGVSKLTLANWENDVTSPRVEMLQKLCRIYGCGLDDIFLPDELTKS